MGESNQDTDNKNKNKNKNFSTTCENQMTRFILKFFKKKTMILKILFTGWQLV